MKNFFDIQRFANISNSTSDTIVIGTAYADSIYNEGDHVTISGGAGNDTITNYGYRMFLTGGSISYYDKGGNYVSINGETGNDVISLSGSPVANTISGGTGDDTIYYGGSFVYQYAAGDGKDTFISNNLNTIFFGNSINISGNYYTTQIGGEDFIINVGDGKIAIKDTSTSPEINGYYDVSDLIEDGVEVVTFSWGDSRDKIYYDGTSKKIVANFSAGKSDNSDVIVITGGDIESIQRSERGTVSINMQNANYIKLQTDSTDSDEVILYSADGENIFGAKIADESTTQLFYDDSVSYKFLAGNLIFLKMPTFGLTVHKEKSSSTLKISMHVTQTAQVFLSETLSQMTYGEVAEMQVSGAEQAAMILYTVTMART